MSASDDDRNGNMRQRLWGAAVFIAALVIVLPLLLDGAGSEREFRRVEKLRQEPPSIVDTDGRRSVQLIPEMQAVGPDGGSLNDADEALSRFRPRIRIGEDDPPDYLKAEQEVRETLEQNRTRTPLTAWVVQAGSYNEHDNAVAIRDRLRRAGFASFVRDRVDLSEPFRVLVGPMISEQSAEASRQQVEQLLGVEALIMNYP